MKALTQKEREVVKLMLLGKNQTEAVFQVYNCKDRNSAGAMATRIMKRPRVKKILEKGQPKVEEHLVRSVEKSITQELEALDIDRAEIAKRFKMLLYSKDQRVVYQALDFYAKLTGLFAPTKQLLLQHSEIYSEIKELKEEGPDSSPQEQKKT